MEEWYAAKYQHDILDSLWLIYVNGPGYRAFRYRYWQCVNALIADNFAGQIQNWCKENHLIFTGHFSSEDGLIYQTFSNGGVMPLYQNMGMPGIDHLGNRYASPVLMKQVTSVAHQQGLPYVLSESFGCAGWEVSFKELLEACYDSVVSMSFVMILTVLAFAVQAINIDLGLADYVISVTQPIMKGAFLPAVVFLVCGVYAYATGCFWDLAAIILPIVVPLAQAMGVDPILASAAVFSGAAFGSNTCLYGDGVIMCAQGCEIKSMDLMFATLPYATISAAISVVLYLICGFMMV